MLEVVATTPSKPLGACVTLDITNPLGGLLPAARAGGLSPARATNFYTLNARKFPTPPFAPSPRSLTKRKLRGFAAGSYHRRMLLLTWEIADETHPSSRCRVRLFRPQLA